VLEADAKRRRKKANPTTRALVGPYHIITGSTFLKQVRDFLDKAKQPSPPKIPPGTVNTLSARIEFAFANV